METHLERHHASIPAQANGLCDTSAQGIGIHVPAIRHVLRARGLSDDYLTLVDAVATNLGDGRAPGVMQERVAVLIARIGGLCQRPSAAGSRRGDRWTNGCRIGCCTKTEVRQ